MVSLTTTMWSVTKKAHQPKGWAAMRQVYGERFVTMAALPIA